MMKKVGKLGEFTLIEDGLWVGTLDKEGNILISPKLHYRNINEFVDGVAVACQSLNEKEALKWGLIDTEGNHISEFKYGYVEEWGEGYYKCEIGNKKNILRKDGSEVLKVWFNDVYKVYQGVFIIGNTIRKTKDHPTLYPRGLASVNGDILFPPMFERLKWHDEVKLDFLWAEKEGKPYLISSTGFIIDPSGDHLPKLSTDKDNFYWDGPKHTICEGCIFTDGINENGEGCRKLKKQEFRNNVIKGSCEHYKQSEQQESYREHWDKYEKEKAEDKASKVSDQYAVKLVKDFIKDELDGDIMNLVTYDFNKLRNDVKYGDCGGYAFSPDSTNTMKAIMSLVFTDAWPEMTYNGHDALDYEISMVNTYMMLLGHPLGETFKGLREFRPTSEILDRAWNFESLCHTIGNYMVMAGRVTAYREQLRRSQRYIDTFLQTLYVSLTNPRKGDTTLVQELHKKKKLYASYRTDEGFSLMCNRLLLADYLDEYGKPKSLFYGVWSDQKDLTREHYFEAIEQYFDFCEEEIQKRSKSIVKRLMSRLGMENTMIEQDDVLKLDMPEDCNILRSLPGDPDQSISYGKETPSALCFIQTYPINKNTVMPLDDIEPIIEGIHKSLADNQGIIEIANGVTKYGKQYVYTIVKSARKIHGMNYILTMHIVKKDKALCIKGQFEERGTTGIRDTTVYEYARRQGLVKEIGGEGWFFDPYDKEYTQGLRMNLSEKEEYDYSFPEHPLSVLRKFISSIIIKN